MTTFDGIYTDKIFQNILESIPEALIFASRDGVIQFWNRGAELTFGYLASDAVGQSLNLIIPESMRDAHWDGYHRAINRGSTIHAGHSMITRSLHQNGKQLYVDISFAIIKNQSGEVIGSAAIARDATERYLKEKNIRKQLAELTEKTQK